MQCNPSISSQFPTFFPQWRWMMVRTGLPLRPLHILTRRTDVCRFPNITLSPFRCGGTNRRGYELGFGLPTSTHVDGTGWMVLLCVGFRRQTVCIPWDECLTRVLICTVYVGVGFSHLQTALGYYHSAVFFCLDVGDDLRSSR